VTQQPRSTFVLRDHSEILEALVGLKDVVVLHDERRGPDVELAIEQLIRDPVRCPSCAVEARVKDRPVVHHVDVPVYGTPMSLAWKKHRMRCVNERCAKKTWMLSDHHGSAEILARLGRDEEVDASEYVFRTSTQMETAAADFDWLNKGVFISVAGRQPAGVIHEVYLVG
jgi:hypothetical protein